LTIDERLQAITMHLELLSQMHEDERKHNEELRKNHADFVSRMEDFVSRMEAFTNQVTTFAADVRDAVVRLTNIAEAHERRLDDLEK